MEDYNKPFISWMYPKNSMLKSVFDHFMLEFYEEGIYDRLKRKNPQICQSDNFMPVDWKFVISLFVILFLGICLSLCTVVLERGGIAIFGNFDQWP